MSTLRPPRVPQLVCGCLTAAVLLGGCSGEQNSATSSANSAGQASGGTDNAGSGGGPVYAAGAGSAAGGASGGSEPSSAGGSPASAGSAGAVLAGQSGSGAGGTSGAPNTAGAAGVAASDSVPLDPALLSKCTGTNPIVCAFDAPNGDYDVTAEVGDPAQAAASRLSAETLHYQGAAVDTAAGVFQKLTFTVNVRMEKHDGGQSAPGNILDIMISGMAPKLHGLGFRAAKNAITLFYAGDSTACDWVDSNTSNLGPGETGSAQALSMYLKPGVAVANYADSGGKRSRRRGAPNRRERWRQAALAS